jgi:hypothetical protein
MDAASTDPAVSDEGLLSLGSSRSNSWLVSEDHANLVREVILPRPVTVQAQGKLITFDLARTAIVIVDMQNDFCHPNDDPLPPDHTRGSRQCRISIT